MLRLVLVLALGLVCSPALADTPSPLYPPIEPFRTGMLPVGDGHELYYELSGNPKGTPVFVLHGGPGSGSSPTMRRFHDPQRWLIVLYDQRGAGKSKPHLGLAANTTPHLVEDVEKLRRHLGLGKIHLFGGSWGSTLALAYAERYPAQVSSLVLRGIFTATRREIDFFYHGGLGAFFPEQWAMLRKELPHPERLDYPQQLLELLTRGDAAQRRRAVKAWDRYETKAAFHEISDSELEQKLAGSDGEGLALIENHYMAKACFLAEGQLLRDAPKLRGIPTILVQGRYDVLCPPETAYRLHQALPGSRLVIVEGAGHTSGEPRMQAALVEAVRSLPENTNR